MCILPCAHLNLSYIFVVVKFNDIETLTTNT